MEIEAKFEEVKRFVEQNAAPMIVYAGHIAEKKKVFRKSESYIGDYQFVQEVVLEANELLIDYATTSSTQQNYGIFTQPVLQKYWVTSSNGITETFNQDFLYDSVKKSNLFKFLSFHQS